MKELSQSVYPHRTGHRQPVVPAPGRLATGILACLAVGVMCGSLSAANATWNKGTGNWVWTDTANWSATPVPGPGDTATFWRPDAPGWSKPVAIDMKGSGYNFKEIYGNYNGSTEVFYDSDFLTPNANPLGTTSATHTNFSYAPYASLVAAANASPLLRLEDMRIGKEHYPVFYMPVTIADELQPTEHSSTIFYGDVTVGRITSPTNNGWGSNVIFKSGLTAGTITIPDRGDAAQEVLTVDGPATVGTLNGVGARADFKNDFCLTTLLRQNNDSIVNISGRFTGAGTYAKDGGTPAINLLAGSTLAPGSSIGRLGGTALSVNLAGGSTYEWEVAAPASSGTPGTDWDLSLADVFNIDGPLNVRIVESALAGNIAPSDVFVILAANSFDLGGINLSSQVAFSVVGDQATWDISQARLNWLTDYADLDGIAGNEDVLALTGIAATFASEGEVPEPASLLLLATGLAGLCGTVRRRSKARP